MTVEPLQETPNPMSCCEPAAPQVETFEERVARATRSMSPEKSRVVRLCIESDARDRWCASILECKRQCRREAKALKRLMKNRRARQNLVPKARTKKELVWEPDILRVGPPHTLPRTCPAVYHPMPRWLPPHAPLSTTPCPAVYHPMPPLALSPKSDREDLVQIRKKIP